MKIGRSLLLFGFACLTVMVFTHVAEGLHFFSRDEVGLARQSRSLPRFCQRRTWLCEELDACFVVRDHTGARLCLFRG
jgi:hypothetical protein